MNFAKIQRHVYNRAVMDGGHALHLMMSACSARPPDWGGPNVTLIWSDVWKGGWALRRSCRDVCVDLWRGEGGTSVQWTLLGSGWKQPSPSATVNRASLTRIDNAGRLANPCAPHYGTRCPQRMEAQPILFCLPMGWQQFTVVRQSTLFPLALFTDLPPWVSSFPSFFFSAQMKWTNTKSMF